ncbi:MAG: hypothetical protein R6V10_01065 [bacterium]
MKLTVRGGRLRKQATALFIFVLSGFLCAGLVEEDLGGEDKPSQPGSSWERLISIMGGEVPAGRSVQDVLGPLPSDTVYRRLDSLTPSGFVTAHELAGQAKRRVMSDLARARLRELSRRGEVSRSDVDLLLGAEGSGLPGSEFFGIPSVPAEAYEALLDYLEYGAELAAGPGYAWDNDSRERLDRSLQASLAVSTRQTRRQYRDFDLVFAIVRREYVCADEDKKKEMRAGMLWLYHQLRGAAGMEWLPAVSPELEERIRKEAGSLFMSARKESASLPATVGVLTRWRCGFGPSQAPAGDR